MKHFPSWALVAIIINISAASAIAGVAGTELWEPSLARTAGAGGSQWFATVWIHNPGTTTATVTVAYLLRGSSNPSPAQQTVTVDPGETLKLGDVFLDLFGLDQAMGALRFRSDRKIVVSARSYNLTASGLADSQGQFIAGLPVELAIGNGKATSIPGITQPADGSFRSNVALVETSGGTATVKVTLLDRDGVQLASDTTTLSPWEPIQFSLSAFGSGITVDGGRVDVEVISGTGRVLTLASMVGNGTVSQDPSTLEMEYELEQGSGSTRVEHDASLSGDGTGADPLGVADNGVTAAKLSASGSSASQVLGSDGSRVGWRDDGLTLPFGAMGSAGESGIVFGIGAGNSDIAIYGMAENSAGVFGGTEDGVGVFGAAEEGVGVLGHSLNKWAIIGYTGRDGTEEIDGPGGVLGKSSAGFGVYGWSSDSTGVRGKSEKGNGTEGLAMGADGAGVSGLSISENGYGVNGYNSYSENTGRLGCGPWAVFGQSSSGEAGHFVSGGTDAVYIENTGNGRGLHVVSNSDTGAWIVTEGSAWAALDVRREADSDQAAYFKGSVTVTGTLTAGSKSFRIDNPVDPENRYLYHTSMESPDRKNLYDGNVLTDGEGYAVVVLPEWFEALNGDFRYQLTVVGGGDEWVLARIAHPIEKGSFVIQTSAPDTKVSWQVTGIRRDPWARRNPAPVDEPKPEALRGTYVHPEAYGASDSAGETRISPR